jgi:hypothetical protein
MKTEGQARNLLVPKFESNCLDTMEGTTPCNSITYPDGRKLFNEELTSFFMGLRASFGHARFLKRSLVFYPIGLNW